MAARRAASGPAGGAGETAGSLDEWLRYFGVEKVSRSRPFSIWPPDIFAIAAAYLRRTGGYLRLIGRLQGGREGRSVPGLADDPRRVGKAWREALREGLPRKGPHDSMSIPPKIGEWWRTLVQEKFDSFDRSAADESVQVAAWNLCVAADEACEGLGTRPAGDDVFLGWALRILASHSGRSYCVRIPPEKLCVLGKQHAPQRGCTIRSLTHHLALYSASEINAHWHGPFAPTKDRLEVFNLLLLPWPIEVSASDFRLVPPMPGAAGAEPHERLHRFFRYRAGGAAKSAKELEARMKRALRGARVHADRIHGIVFPELALTLPQFTAAERVAIRNRAMLIAGVGVEPAESPTGLPLNMCAIQPYGLSSACEQPGMRRPNRLSEGMLLTQYKHHQWCLDGVQIMQYELGARLPASHECWEDIDIVERRINFTTLSSWLTMCVLICEDLARQDPVADVIRAVGPNLVVALLMDGPQLRHRWAARYASVLAEDPGCSVLSLTSVGMSARSRPREENASDKRRVVALWRDAFSGDKEISLAPGHDACVLSLVCNSKPEFTLDGHEDRHTHYPVFAGAYSFDSRGAA